MVADAVAAGLRDGMTAFVEAFEAGFGFRFPEPDRTLTLERNDPAALAAAWRSVAAEGAVSADLTTWRVPCLICAGSDDEMHAGAKRAAAEIPGATFVSLEGLSHIAAFYDADELLLPHILGLLRAVP